MDLIEHWSEFSVTSLFVIYRDESREEAAEIVKGQGCSFPVWTINRNHELIQDLRINGYPCVLVFDEEGYLVFKGDIEDVSDLLE